MLALSPTKREDPYLIHYIPVTETDSEAVRSIKRKSFANRQGALSGSSKHSYLVQLYQG